jgi:hypothetical protein
MDANKVVNEAAEFLENYTLEKDFFSPPDVVAALEADPEDEEAKANTVLMFRQTAPGDDPNELYCMFTCGQELSEEDPAVVKAANDCIGALKAAMPELSPFKIQVEITRGE